MRLVEWSNREASATLYSKQKSPTWPTWKRRPHNGQGLQYRQALSSYKSIYIHSTDTVGFNALNHILTACMTTWWQNQTKNTFAAPHLSHAWLCNVLDLYHYIKREVWTGVCHHPEKINLKYIYLPMIHCHHSGRKSSQHFPLRAYKFLSPVFQSTRHSL